MAQAAPAKAALAPFGGSAIARAASRTASGFDKGQGLVVFTAPLRTDEPAPRSTELTERIASLVAGALGPHATSHQGAVSLPTALALAPRVGKVMFLEVEIAREILVRRV